MRPKGLKPVAVFLFLTTAVLATPGHGLSQAIDCRGTVRAWEADKSLNSYMSAYTCTCPTSNAQPVCTKNMTGAPAKSNKKSGKIDFQKQVAATVVGSLLAAVFTFDSPNADDQAHQEQLRQQAELEKQALEIKKQNAVQQWKALQYEEALKKDREAQQKQKAGQDLLAKMGSPRGGLTSFKWEKSQESELQYKPVEAPQYPTAKFNTWQRLLCAAYFSSNALNATKGKNFEQVRYLNEQADRVMAGQPTTMECKLPAVPVPPDPKGAQKLTTALTAIQAHVQSLQKIETQLTDVKERVTAADKKKEAAQFKLEEAQIFVAAAKPEEKAEADNLLAEALAALQESEKELADARQSEEALIQEKDKTENEIKDIEKQLASSGDN
jgi:hypothetical protein